MKTTYICRPCRQRIASVASQRAIQRASFVSITTPVRRRNSASAGSEEQPIQRSKQNGPQSKYSEQRRRPLRTGDPGDSLEALFKTTIRRTKSSPTLEKQAALSLGIYKHAETLKQYVASDTVSAAVAWDFFLEHFGPEAWEKGSIDRTTAPSYLYIRNGTYSGQALIRKLMRAKAAEMSAGPTFTEITKVFIQLEALHGNDWADMMCVLLDSIIEQPRSSEIADLLGAWNIITQRERNRTKRHEINSTRLDWSHIFAVSDREIMKDLTKYGIKAAFSHLSPTFSAPQRDDIALVALATFCVLRKHQDVQPVLIKNSGPFLDAITRVLKLPEVTLDMIPRPHTSNGSPIMSYVAENWKYIKHEAAQFFVQPVHFSLENRPERGKSIVVNHHKRLEDALRRKDIRLIDNMWEEAETYPIHFAPDTPVPRGYLSAGMSNHFIQVYMALRNPNRAVDVWNHMIKSNLTPNIITWDSMLKGCKISRDANALEDVWARLETSGLTPDIYCWTSRVSGLTECGKSKLAMTALGDMGRLWLKKAREQYGKDKKLADLQEVGDLEGATKPSVELVNAAISGLLRHHRSMDTQQVLAWAATFGIRPNVETYNTLLRPLVREGNTAAAMSILRHMKADGLDADVVTFTTILEETFRHSADYTPEEQKETISKLFAEMDEAGVKANQWTYGRLVFQLLQTNLKDMAPINAILERMDHDGITITPHIYTMLVEYYFRQPQPNMDAIIAIIEKVKSEDDGGEDIFWDRVINGYAEIGDTATAMRILGQITSVSVRRTMRTGWPTLNILLEALVKNNEWDIAKTLIKDIKIDSGGPIADHVHGKDGQHKFWSYVESLHLSDA